MDYSWYKSQLNEGDWVTLSVPGLNGFIGFVKKFDSSDNTYRIQLTRNSKGKPSSGSLWVEAEYITPATVELNEKFIDGLIDAALATEQKWLFLAATSEFLLKQG